MAHPLFAVLIIISYLDLNVSHPPGFHLSRNLLKTYIKKRWKYVTIMQVEQKKLR